MNTRYFDFLNFITRGMDSYERIGFFTDTYYIWKGLHGLPEDDAFFTEFLANSVANTMFKGLDGCFVEKDKLWDINNAWLVFKTTVEHILKQLDADESQALIHNNRYCTFLFSEHGCSILDIVDLFPIATAYADDTGDKIVIKFSIEDAKMIAKNLNGIEEVLDNKVLLGKVYDYLLSQVEGNKA